MNIIFKFYNMKSLLELHRRVFLELIQASSLSLLRLIQDAKLVFMVFLYIGVWLDLGLQIYYAMKYYDDDDKLDQELLDKNITAEERADRDEKTGELVRVLCNLENHGGPSICSIACTNHSYSTPYSTLHR